MSKFHTVYTPPPRSASPAGDKSMAEQQFRDECNIDRILKRFAQGDNSQVRNNGIFADVSGLKDFASSLEVVRRATEDFAALPAEVRSRFGNDPAALVAFLSSSDNDDEAVKLGLKVRPVAEPTLSEQIVNGVTKALAEGAKSPDGSASANT